MKTTGWGTAVAVLGTVGFLGGCNDATTGPDVLNSQFTATAALVAADAALEDLSAMGLVPGLASGISAAPGQGGMGPRGDLVRDRQVTFFDGAGGEQDELDPLTTASIHTILTMTGDIARDGLTASIDRSRDMWVTGLEGEETERTWNGTGSQTHTRSRVDDDRGTRSYSLVGDATIDDVVRAVDREAHPWPLSGSITRHVIVTIEGGPNGGGTRERTTVIVFDGTQFATLTVDGEVFQVDLDARDHENPLRRRNGRAGRG